MYVIEAPRSQAGTESGSARDSPGALFAHPAAEPTTSSKDTRRESFNTTIPSQINMLYNIWKRLNMPVGLINFPEN